MKPVLLITILISSGVVVDRVDVVEINTVLDGDDPLFSQVIWWDVDDDGTRHIVAWRMCQYYDVIPRPVGSQFVSEWVDRNGMRRRVWASSMLTSSTQYDVELEAREGEPCDRRRGLKRANRHRHHKAS